MPLAHCNRAAPLLLRDRARELPLRAPLVRAVVARDWPFRHFASGSRAGKSRASSRPALFPSWRISLSAPRTRPSGPCTRRSCRSAAARVTAERGSSDQGNVASTSPPRSATTLAITRGASGRVCSSWSQVPRGEQLEVREFASRPAGALDAGNQCRPALVRPDLVELPRGFLALQRRELVGGEALGVEGGGGLGKASSRVGPEGGAGVAMGFRGGAGDQGAGQGEQGSHRAPQIFFGFAGRPRVPPGAAPPECSVRARRTSRRRNRISTGKESQGSPKASDRPASRLHWVAPTGQAPIPPGTRRHSGRERGCPRGAGDPCRKSSAGQNLFARFRFGAF